jgi:hypothetical protein
VNLDPPERVKIGPHRYDVVREPDKFRSDADDCYLAGQIDYDQGVIRLLERNPYHLFETFIHECLHGMNNVAELDLEENEVARLSNVLAAFLIDNGYVQEPPPKKKRGSK